MTDARAPSSWFATLSVVVALGTLADFIVGLADGSRGFAGVFTPQLFMASAGLVAPWQYMVLIALAGAMLLISVGIAMGRSPSPIAVGILASAAVIFVLATGVIGPVGWNWTGTTSGTGKLGGLQDAALRRALIAGAVFLLAGVSTVSLAYRRRQHLWVAAWNQRERENKRNVG